MAGRIREEHVTKALLQWLIDSNWKIICFDFPQSGTGKVLHPDNTNSKTEGAIIPDIVAIKGSIVVDFENKDRFVLEDFDKVAFLRHTSVYDRDYAKLLEGYSFNHIYYGIGMPFSAANYKKSMSEIDKVDFIFFLKEDGSFEIIDKPGSIFEL